MWTRLSFGHGKKQVLIASNGNGPVGGIAVEYSACDIAATVGHDIIVRERIASAIFDGLMNDASVMICYGILVIAVGLATVGELGGIQERAAIEGGGKTGDDGISRAVVTSLEWPFGARPDVSRVGLLEGASGTEG